MEGFKLLFQMSAYSSTRLSSVSSKLSSKILHLDRKISGKAHQDTMWALVKITQPKLSVIPSLIYIGLCADYRPNLRNSKYLQGGYTMPENAMLSHIATSPPYSPNLAAIGPIQ